ncbi:hypothetical protein MRX96_015142 [Rhipicephalus microplus]
MPSSSPVERWRADRDSPPLSSRSQQCSWLERWMARRRNPAAAAFATRGLEAAGYPLFMIIARPVWHAASSPSRGLRSCAISLAGRSFLTRRLR